MKYLNVAVTGLRGRLHPSLSELVTPQDVKKSRIHLKMLVGDYMTFEIKSQQSGGSPMCRGCLELTPSIESLEHILTECKLYSDIRTRIFTEYENACNQTKNKLNFSAITQNKSQLCQFILDPSSLNLHIRVNIADNALGTLFKISRDFCYAVNAARLKYLRNP